MKLWGGRFTKETNQLVNNFNASLPFDRRFYKQDIEGSIAHVTMLAKQGILSNEDKEAIIAGLTSIRNDIDSGALQFDDEAEDIHSFVEAELISRIGDAGKRLHTGRSRNDQVALDCRMYVKDAAKEAIEKLKSLMSALLDTAQQHTLTIMPGYTHMQKAQPITLAHYMMAYVQMFLRDRKRFQNAFDSANVMPLGSGALAGTTYPLNRARVAELLGFSEITRNSLDGVSDRDFVLDYLYACSVMMMHLSRFCEEIILWNTNEFRFVEIDDGYATGSSIMPQKKNPDMAELTRGKTGRVYGDLVTLLTVMKGLPLAYNKDMQEDKEALFDARDTLVKCLDVFTGMFKTLKFRKDVMHAGAGGGFANATDAADYLVKKGLPFREAHEVLGRLVLHCIKENKALLDLPLAELKEFSPLFEQDVYDAISLETCVRQRNVPGGPAPAMVENTIRDNRDFLAAH